MVFITVPFNIHCHLAYVIKIRAHPAIEKQGEEY